MGCNNLVLLLVAFKKLGLSDRCRVIFLKLFIQTFIDDLYYHQYINYITIRHLHDTLFKKSCLQLNPTVIKLFTVLSLIEYYITDISYIKFIILNISFLETCKWSLVFLALKVEIIIIISLLALFLVVIIVGNLCCWYFSTTICIVVVFAFIRKCLCKKNPDSKGKYCTF